HQPLTAGGDKVSKGSIMRYLFGPNANNRGGGFFNVPTSDTDPIALAFDEDDFGSEAKMYGNVWWIDSDLRQIRKYLNRKSVGHCITGAGRSDFVSSVSSCPGGETAANTSDLPNLATNTVILFLSDNGFHLPRAKHHFTENGYRTRLITYDPTSLKAQSCPTCGGEGQGIDKRRPPLPHPPNPTP